MRLHDLEKANTRKLLHSIKQITRSSWAMAALAGMCLSALALREDSLAATDKLLVGALAALLALILALQFWWVTRRVLPELEKRCVDVQASVPEPGIDKTETFKRQQRQGRLGMWLFLLSIPIALAAAIVGYPPFTDSGLPTLAGWLIIVGVVGPGLFLILRSAQCPACGKLISTSYEDKAQCPHCGARIKNVG